MVNRSLSVFIPAYQEEGNIEATVCELRAALQGQEALTYEIIIVNDGSTDRTGAIADTLAQTDPTIRVVHNPQNLGLARTYGVGALATKYEYIGWIPGDNGFPAESLKKWLAPLGHADLIQTYLLNSEVRYLNRRLISIAYTKTMNLLFGLNLKYYNGIQICRRDLLLGVTTHSDGFALLSEILVKLLTQGSSFVEVGINMQERLQGQSKAVRLHNILDVLLTMLRLFLEIKFIYRRRYHSRGQRIAWPPVPEQDYKR
jgi:dolichol-phosphate mannosyltransferase